MKATRTTTSSSARRPETAVERIEARLGQPGLLSELKARLVAAHGDRLKGVVLYGSVARGEETPDSDIDVMALITGPTSADRRQSYRQLHELICDSPRPISIRHYDWQRYEKRDSPLADSVHDEGIWI